MVSGGFWDWAVGFDTNKAGFVIVGMFIVCWICAVAFWKVARVEEKWNSRLQPPDQITSEAAIDS